MGNLKDLKADPSVKPPGDYLGGFNALDSGLYNMVVEMAYMDESKAGARNLNLTLQGKSGMLKQTIYVTTNRQKGQRPTYKDKDGHDQFLPGMNIANALCELTCGKELADMDTEEKVVKVYDREAKAEVNKQKDVITDLLGQKIGLGIVKQIVDKNIQDSSGNWVPSGQTLEANEIEAVFDSSTGMTISEMRKGSTEAKFIHKWALKNKGVTRNKAKGAAAGTPSAAPAASATPSLFTD